MIKEEELQQLRAGKAVFIAVDFSGADLSGNDWEDWLNEASFSQNNIEEASSLQDTNLRRVIGLTKERLAACRAKGALTDKDPAPSTNASSVPTAHGNTPPPNPSGNTTTSAHHDPNP